MGRIPVYLLLAAIWGAAPAGAALYHGMVKESRFGAGIDSVKVSVSGASASIFTDSSGAFSLSAVPAVPLPARRRPEILWHAGPGLLAWTGLEGSLSLTIADAGGRTVFRFAASGSPADGQVRIPALRPGFHFAEVRAMGRVFSWRWCQAGYGAQGPGLVLPDGGDRVFPLAAQSWAGARTGARTAAVSDTLLFERRGFLPVRMAVDGSRTGLEVRLERKPIRILIVDGMGNHFWEQTTRIARAIYARAGFFTVDASTAPGTADPVAWRAWRPEFGNYEVVLLNYNSGTGSGSLRWPEAREIELQDFVKGGGGLYVLHSSNNSFPGWKEYNKMIAVGWRGADFGFALEVGPAGNIVRIPPEVGRGTTHGKRADVLIHLLDRHPIHKGYPGEFLASALEIYEYARGPAENLRVLSYAFDGPASGGSLKNWPIELLVDYGRGRIYNATPGHVWAGDVMPDAVRDLSFQTTFIRASEWLARREVLYPVPAEFNTASKIVYRDLDLP